MCGRGGSGSDGGGGGGDGALRGSPSRFSLIFIFEFILVSLPPVVFV